MLKIKSIECIEVRKFYDSTWKIEFENGLDCMLTRDDLETEQELRKDIENCDSVEEVKSLDMRHKIYYD